jgi:hypothetical protein
MNYRTCARLALAVLLLVPLASRAAEEEELEVSGMKIGTLVPELSGAEWVSADGKAPDLKGKVYVVDFWFER